MSIRLNTKILTVIINTDLNFLLYFQKMYILSKQTFLQAGKVVKKSVFLLKWVIGIEQAIWGNLC